MSVARQTSQANVKFIRIGGDAPTQTSRSTPRPRRSRPRWALPAPPAAVAVRARRGRVASAVADASGADAYPGDDAPKDQIAAWMAKRGREARAPAAAADHGLTCRVRPHQHPLRRRRLRRLLPDARRHLEPGRLRRLPRQARAPAQVVPRPGRAVKATHRRRQSTTDPHQFGEWIADVERPATQYRDRYQLKLADADDLLGSAASTPPAPRSTPQPCQGLAATAADAAGGRKKQATLEFMAVKAEDAAARKHRATVQFMKAVDPKQASAAGAPRRCAGGTTSGRRRRIRRSRHGPDGGRGRGGEPGRRRPGPRERARAAGRRADRRPTRATTPRQRELAKWLAKQAEKAGLPPELPVMASLVESGVKNLNYGDADSVGFFQMRVGIWNQGALRGLPREARSCRRSGSSTTRSPSSAADRRRRRQLRQGPGASSASGSPTSSARRRSTAAATSCGSTRRAGCWT